MSKKTTPPPSKLAPEWIDDLQEKVFAHVEPLLEERFFLLDVVFEREVGQWFLRLFVEGKGFRISLNECEAISRLVEPTIDAVFEKQKNAADFPYFLEVSSPGLFRPLKSDREFTFYQGSPVKIQASVQSPGAAEAGVLKEGILEGYDVTQQVVYLKDLTGAQVPVTLDSGMTVTLNPKVEALDLPSIP